MVYAQCMLSVLIIGMSMITSAYAPQKNEQSNQERIQTMSENKEVKAGAQAPQPRPQEPKPPFPYHEKEVSYDNKTAGITLSGTLTIPQGKGPFPTAIIISGMGPTPRDGMMLGHKPYLVLADYLTRNGIATLRFDKRGVGKSTGIFGASVTCRDLADDVLAGIDYLKTCKDIDMHAIGLIGHSEGGLVASIVAAQSKDIAFVILMAGAVANGTQNLVEQVAIQLRADGASQAMIESDSKLRRQILDLIKRQEDATQTEKQMRTLFADYWASLPEEQKAESIKLVFAFSQPKIDGQIAFMNSPYYRFMLTYDAAQALAHIQAPLLAINGELDFMAPRLVFPFIHTAMTRGNKKNYITLELSKLNHAFQTCATGAMAEYATIEETISPIALKTISDWILAQIK